MAYPTSADNLPTSAGNSTPSEDTHPDLHNDANAAINEIEDALLGAGMGYVDHGATAATARPEGFIAVTWHGSVEPDNAEDGDLWVDST